MIFSMRKSPSKDLGALVEVVGSPSSAWAHPTVEIAFTGGAPYAQRILGKNEGIFGSDTDFTDFTVVDDF